MIMKSWVEGVVLRVTAIQELGLGCVGNFDKFCYENPVIGPRFEPALRASTRNCLPSCNSNIGIADTLTR
jgi:hypothetical protein